MQVLARLDHPLGERFGERLGLDRRDLNPPIQLSGYGGDAVRKDVVLLQRRLEVRNDFSLRLLIQGLREDRCWSQRNHRQQRDKNPRNHHRPQS
ncbi:hypothetical protein D3C87_1500810 [compost metagenome]